MLRGGREGGGGACGQGINIKTWEECLLDGFEHLSGLKTGHSAFVSAKANGCLQITFVIDSEAFILWTVRRSAACLGP